MNIESYILWGKFFEHGEIQCKIMKDAKSKISHGYIASSYCGTGPQSLDQVWKLVKQTIWIGSSLLWFPTKPLVHWGQREHDISAELRLLGPAFALWRPTLSTRLGKWGEKSDPWASSISYHWWGGALSPTVYFPPQKAIYGMMMAYSVLCFIGSHGLITTLLIFSTKSTLFYSGSLFQHGWSPLP